MLPDELNDGPFVIPITDTIDLHSVPPRDVKEVVEAWLAEVKSRSFVALRIIHGRGIGARRELVRSILLRDPDVLHFSDAPLEAGGWGATVVTLKPPY
jgi:DNA-nicking Smr family endonuclease